MSFLFQYFLTLCFNFEEIYNRNSINVVLSRIRFKHWSILTYIDVHMTHNLMVLCKAGTLTPKLMIWHRHLWMFWIWLVELRIHWLNPIKNGKSQPLQNGVAAFDREARILENLWVCSTTSWPLFPWPFRPWAEVPVSVLSKGQIVLFKNYSYSIDPCAVK